MSNRKNKKPKKSKIKEEKHILNKRVLLIFSIFVAIAIFILLGFYLKNQLSIQKYTKVIPKEVVRSKIFGFKGTLTAPRVLTDPAQFSDSFAAEDILDDNGNTVGTEVTILIDNPSYNKDKKRIPKDVAMLLIVDKELKIKTLTPFNPTYFDLGIDFEKYFNDYNGKDAETIIKQTDGIYTGVSSVATIIKNKVREAMSLLYIEKYGKDKFNALGVSGYIFSERGTKLTQVTFKDVNGTEYNINDFKNNKIVIIGGNPGCGSCVESITQLANLFKTYNTENIKFIVFAFTQEKDQLLRLTAPLGNNVIGVLDPDRTIATQLKVNISPYIELVDKDLTVYYRGPGEPIRETIENIKAFLQK
ncbi:TlpA family protein disulfide reductase [Caldisericum exile]|uniref:TlpA family protein disulfide reductase n=1 Tax=Caldisericum exile TaxID=693075 RepID=UPI003C79671E